MTDNAGNERARDPQDLERLLVARQWAGDIDAMAALYEPDAILDAGDGQLIPKEVIIDSFDRVFAFAG